MSAPTKKQHTRSVAGSSATQQNGGELCETDQVIGSPASVTLASAAAVSPAISLAASPNGREQRTTETKGSKSSDQSGSQSPRPKPNCYACIHRDDLPGDAHSSCAHPAASTPRGRAAAQTLLVVGMSARHGDKIQLRADTLQLSATLHGIRNGWCFWPFTFDPVWISECTGFAEKEREASS